MKKKKIIAILSSVVILGSIFIFINYRNAKRLEDSNYLSYEEIVTLKVGEINDSIIVSGKVKSGEVSNVSTSIAAKVKSINVSVGDVVEAGDIICTLDSSNIEKDIEKKSKAIEEERKTLQNNYNKLLNQLESLKNKQAEDLNKHNKLIDIAVNKVNNSNTELSNYQATFNSVKNTYNIMLKSIEDEQKNYNNALNNKDRYYEEWVKSGGGTNSKEYKKYVEATENLENKEKELEDAKKLYEYDDISNKYNESLKIYNEKIEKRDAAKVEYEEAVSNSKSSDNSNKEEMNSVQANINDVSKQIEKLNDDEELKELKENLSKTVLKAETSGKITEVKVNVGSMAEGVVATIQSTENLILEVNIPEYDIKKVTTGMKAKIISNSVDNKVNGELIGISPIASNEENAGFSATIAIEKY